MKKKPFTWQHLVNIWHDLGLEPREAHDILFENVLDKNWMGTDKKQGRMWNDLEIRAMFLMFLDEVTKYQKKNRVSFGKAVMRLFAERENGRIKNKVAFWFVAISKIKTSGMTAATFLKKVDIWKKLPFVNLPKRELSESYKKRQTQIRNLH